MRFFARIVAAIFFVLGVVATNHKESIQIDSKRRVMTTFLNLSPTNYVVVATNSYCLHLWFWLRQPPVTKSLRPIYVKNPTCKPILTIQKGTGWEYISRSLTRFEFQTETVFIAIHFSGYIKCNIPQVQTANVAENGAIFAHLRLP